MRVALGTVVAAGSWDRGPGAIASPSRRRPPRLRSARRLARFPRNYPAAPFCSSRHAGWAKQALRTRVANATTGIFLASTDVHTQQEADMEQKNQGEGNREADRRYRRGVRETVEETTEEERARRARDLTPEEQEAARAAEEQAKAKRPAPQNARSEACAANAAATNTISLLRSCSRTATGVFSIASSVRSALLRRSAPAAA